MDSSITQIAAWIATATFIVMVIFQILLALGLPLGEYAWGGKNKVLPSNLRIGSLVSAGIFVFASVSVLEKAELISIINSPKFVSVAVWILTVLFGLSTLANLATESKKGKRLGFPLALTSTLMCFIVAISSN